MPRSLNVPLLLEVNVHCTLCARSGGGSCGDGDQGALAPDPESIPGGLLKIQFTASVQLSDYCRVGTCLTISIISQPDQGQENDMGKMELSKSLQFLYAE